MEAGFITVSFKGYLNQPPINPLVKLLPQKYYWNYILKKLPVAIEKVEYIGEKGQNIILPIEEKQLENCTKEYIEKLVEKISEKYQVYIMCFPEEIKRYINIDSKISTIVKYVMLEQIVEKILYMKSLDYKYLKMAIIDSGDEKVNYVITRFIDHLNYLTIITNRVNYFTEITENIYNSTGLVVETIEPPLQNKLESNLIIDLSTEINKNYHYYETGATVLDIIGDKHRIKNLATKRKDITIIQDIRIYSEENIIDNNILSDILIRKNQNLNNFIFESSNNCSIEDFKEAEIKYALKLKELKLIGRST